MDKICTVDLSTEFPSGALDIRSGPGTDYRLLDKTNSNIVYHIVEVIHDWGKLSSRLGWIYLGGVNKL